MRSGTIPTARGWSGRKETAVTNDSKDPKKPVDVPPEETPDSLPDIPERPVEEPGPDLVPEEAPDVTPVPGEEVPAKM